MSGFVNHDYVLTFQIADDAKRAELIGLCDGPWMGDRVTDHTWEISTDLEPDELEAEIERYLADGDRAAYYYLSDSKRMFRVDLGG